MTKAFTRGSLFTKANTVYVLIRESRPLVDQLSGKVTGYVYNMYNLDRGSVRYTETQRVFGANEPINEKTVSDRFGDDFKFMCHITIAQDDIVQGLIKQAREYGDDFSRGHVFYSKAKNAVYALVRESRPLKDQLTGSVVGYCYNLVNLRTGKMRYTEKDRAFRNNEPITASALTDRFDLELTCVGHLRDWPGLSAALIAKYGKTAFDKAIDAMKRWV